MQRIISTILLILMIPFLLPACADLHGLNTMTFVLAMGIDKGSENKIRLTVEIPVIRESLQDKAGAQGTSVNIISENIYTTACVEAKSFYEAASLLETFLSRRLNFSHLMLIALSEELAESGLMQTYISSIASLKEIPKPAYLIITICTAGRFLKSALPFIGTSLSKTFENMSAISGYTCFFPYTSLDAFHNALMSNYEQPAAALASVRSSEDLSERDSEYDYERKSGTELWAGDIARSGGMDIEFFGTAIFNGSKMVGRLNGDETRFMLIARGEFINGVFNFEDPENSDLIIPIKVESLGKPAVSVRLEGKIPIIKIKVRLTGQILDADKRRLYEDKALKHKIERDFGSYINSSLDELMEKCKNLKADVFGFGDRSVSQFLTISDLEDYDWINQFDSSEISIKVDFTIKPVHTVLY